MGRGFISNKIFSCSLILWTSVHQKIFQKFFQKIFQMIFQIFQKFFQKIFQMIIFKHLVKTGPKNTVENMKHFKIQLLFNNPKSTAAVISTQKKYRFLKFKTSQNTSLILVGRYAKSTPFFNIKQREGARVAQLPPPPPRHGLFQPIFPTMKMLLNFRME